MPGGMSGCDLAERVRELYPDVRIVLSSGYADDTTPCAPHIRESVLLLPKPYRRADLARTLATALVDRAPANLEPEE